MIDYTAVRRSIEKHIDANFTEVAVQYENTRIPEADEFVALFDQEATADVTEVGGSVSMVKCGLIIQIFTPLGEGTERSREIASLLTNMLNGLQTDVLTFESAVLSSVGQTEGIDFYQQNLTIPYTYAYAGNEILC